MKLSNEVKIGIIVVSALAVLIWGVNFLKGKGLFTSNATVYAIYNRVDGLVASNPVVINGFKIGQVNKVEMIPDKSGNLLVTLRVREDINIPKNSIARIVSTDLLGAKAVELKFGDSEKMIADGDTLTSEIEGSIKDEVNRSVAPIVTKARELLSSLDTVLTIVQEVFNEDTREVLTKSFERINSTIKSIEHTSFTLDTLLTTEKSRLAAIFANIESISSNLKNNNEQINRAINNFAAISDSLAKSNLASTIEKTRQTLDQTAEIMNKINSGKGTMGMLVNNDSLYNNLNNTARDLDNLLVDLRENPKKYVQFSVVSFGGGKGSKPKKTKAPKNPAKASQ